MIYVVLKGYLYDVLKGYLYDPIDYVKAHSSSGTRESIYKRQFFSIIYIYIYLIGKIKQEIKL